MPPITPVPVPAGPPVPDSSVAAPTFDAQYETFNAWEKDDLQPGINALAENVYDNAVDALASAVASASSAAAALSSENAAELSAAAAAASAGALPWNAATAYVLDQRATDPTNKRVYYRKVPGTTGTQPSADATNWGIAPGQFVDDPITAGTTAQCAVWVNTQLRNAGAAMTAAVPAGMQHKERFKLAVQNGRTDNVLTLGSYLFKGPSGIVYDTSITLELALPMEIVYDAPNNTLNWE